MDAMKVFSTYLSINMLLKYRTKNVEQRQDAYCAAYLNAMIIAKFFSQRKQVVR